MIRRSLFALAFATLSLGAMVGAEIVLALRREYLPTSPVLDVRGTFGPRDGRPLRFVVLGDSTAAGVGAGTADLAYPTLLARRLAADGFRVELLGIGISGARVRDVLEDQVADAVAARPDLIFIGIGANDATHVTPLDAVRRDMGEVLDRLRPTGATIVVAGAPDMRAAAFHEPLRSLAGWRGRRVTDAIAAAARERGVPAVALAEQTGHFFQRAPEIYLSEDLFHPSAAGYEKWADAIEPVLRKALAANG